MHLSSGVILQGGRYRIVRFISSGGFGCTYEAEHVLLGTRVAIKEFFIKQFCNREPDMTVTVPTEGNKVLVGKLLKKFIDEAKVLASFKHPGIVHVSDVFSENGTAYYVMEYIDGASLSEIVQRDGALPERLALKYILEVSDALKYVHGKNRLHMDVKPGNIMIDGSGHAILIDFGASKHYSAETGENTSTLTGMNTPGYAPVEQINQSNTTFSPSTDIYSLGATLYKLLTGITPPNSVSLMSREETLPPLPSSISVNTRTAVSSAMQLIRSDRPQSIESFVRLLTVLPAEEEIEATVVQPGKKVQEITAKPSAKEYKEESNADTRKKKPSFKWLYSLIALTLVVIFIFVYLSKSSKENSSDSYTVESSVCGSHRGHDYVDLGLPSGLKWATCNVGASSPEEYGSYYAWGETFEKSEYTKENSVTNNKRFGDISCDSLYDAARYNWGGSWRLPTKSETKELSDNCSYKWTIYKGVKGGLFTSKKNGKKLFLPAAGYRDSTSLAFAGDFGLYWSSTPDEGHDYGAYDLNLDVIGNYWGDWDDRCDGYSVRPVSE